MSEKYPTAATPWRLAQLERKVNELEIEIDKRFEIQGRKIDRLLWGLVMLTLSIAGSAVVFALTVLSIRGKV